MSNLGIPEIMIIAVIIMLLGTPALLAIIFIALRRGMASGGPVSPPAPEQSAQPASSHLRAAGHVRADGSLLHASGGLRAQRLEQGVYQLEFDGFDPERQYLLYATPLAEQPGAEPALVEMLAGQARARYVAAGAAEHALLVWVRLPDQRLADRDWMVQIIEVA